MSGPSRGVSEQTPPRTTKDWIKSAIDECTKITNDKGNNKITQSRVSLIISFLTTALKTEGLANE
jgi:hypothetical protein